MKYHKFLSKSLLFKDINIETVEPYLQRGEYKRIAKGEVLLMPDTENNTLFLVLDGCLSVHLDSPETPPIAEVGAGECVGEMSIFDQGQASAYVLAALPSELLGLDEETLWALVNTSHGVARNLLYILSQRVRYGNLAISDSRKVIRQLEHFAMIDPLTGLYNRRWMNQMFEREFQRCLKSDAPLCLIMMDVDYFKKYNDRYGHLGGDEALCFIGKMLRDQLRPNDMMTRYGGEEFAMLFPRVTLENTINVAERIRKTIETASKEHLPSAPITVSLGIGQMAAGDTLQAVIAKADAALYRAKNTGRNCVAV